MKRFILLLCLPVCLFGQVKDFKVANIKPNSLELEFNTRKSQYVYAELRDVEKKNKISERKTKKAKSHVLTFDDLEPSTLYELSLRTGKKPKKYLLITASKMAGEILIYFNNESDTSYSDGSYANGQTGSELEAHVLDIIDNAENTLDVCGYNTNRVNFVNALIDAHNRGVRVRYIADVDQNNNALQGSLPFTVLYGSTGDGIMHNKWIIADIENDAEAKVCTGSTNWTSGQMLYDPNHTITIRDKSIAMAYTMEFEEMWGGSGEEPNYGNLKFGSNKTDNTPHFFNVAGTPIELYFSPSDRPERVVADVIEDADERLLLALLLFTRESYIDAIADKFDPNKDFRILIEDEISSMDIIDEIEQINIPFGLHDIDDIFHYKYAIIDEGVHESDPTVICGSMNWTFSGSNFNDENTLVIHSQRIANIFKQDFEVHWKQLVSSNKPKPDPQGVKIKRDAYTISVDSEKEIKSLKVINESGKLCSTSNKNSIDIHLLKSGYYFLIITVEDKNLSYPFFKG